MANVKIAIGSGLLIPENAHPGFSVDCVIITFHDNRLKVLLNKFELSKKWMLPGGFVGGEEGVDTAAHRILHTRTGLKNVFLRQFYLFGNENRTNISENENILKLYNIEIQKNCERFISIGYYALVEFDKVKIKKYKGEECRWFDLDVIPALYGDHNHIIEKALKYLQMYINFYPIGYELLPEKFTISELRKVYEGILKKELERKNFQKKMLTADIIVKLNERRDVSTYPKPILFSFNKEKIKQMKDYY